MDIEPLKFALYGRAGPESGMLLLKASAVTIEKIVRAISKRGWHLRYHLRSPFLKADKVFVECCVKVPTPLMGRFSEILSMVETLHRVPEPDQGHSKLVEVQRAKDVEEDRLDEGVCDGLEGWDD